MASFTTYVFLAVLYYTQGVPYGLQTRVLPYTLAEKNASFLQVTMINILSLPWLMRPLFASYFDSKPEKKKLLLLSFAALIGISTFGALLEHTKYSFILTMLFFYNCGCCAMDVVVDSLAMDFMDTGRSLAYINSIQIFMYKSGALFGSLVLYAVSTFKGNRDMFFVLAALYFACFLIASIKNIPTKKHKDKTKNGKLEKSSETEKDVAKKNRVSDMSLAQKFNVVKEMPGIKASAAYLLLYKIAESTILVTIPLVTEKMSMNPFYSMLVTGAGGIVLSLTGSFLGTFVAQDTRKLPNRLKILSNFVAISVLVMFISTVFSSRPNASVLCMVAFCCLQFFGGMATTVTFTCMMASAKQAPETIRQFYFSLLSTLELGGKLLIPMFIGVIMSWTNLRIGYALITAMSFCTGMAAQRIAIN